MSGVSVKAIAARVLGTVLLAAGLLFFIARAPFLTVPEEDVVVPAPLTAVESPALPENLASPPPGFALGANGLSGPLALQPTLGLFEADFAGVDGEVGFSTSEDKVAGECKDAGRRYIDQECSGCGLLGDADTSDMLLWQQSVDGKPVVRSVSRHCLKVAPDGQAIVGTLTFGDDSIELGQGANKTRGGQVPLITGATRLASIRLGMWSATYDKVPQPASALQDMTTALLVRGWREVSDTENLPQAAFNGQRVFTNDGSAVCVISLTRQGQDYQLLTIISLRA